METVGPETRGARSCSGGAALREGERVRCGAGTFLAPRMVMPAESPWQAVVDPRGLGGVLQQGQQGGDSSYARVRETHACTNERVYMEGGSAMHAARHESATLDMEHDTSKGANKKKLDAHEGTQHNRTRRHRGGGGETSRHEGRTGQGQGGQGRVREDSLGRTDYTRPHKAPPGE